MLGELWHRVSQVVVVVEVNFFLDGIVLEWQTISPPRCPRWLPRESSGVWGVYFHHWRVYFVSTSPNRQMYTEGDNATPGNCRLAQLTSKGYEQHIMVRTKVSIWWCLRMERASAPDTFINTDWWRTSTTTCASGGIFGRALLLILVLMDQKSLTSWSPAYMIRNFSLTIAVQITCALSILLPLCLREWWGGDSIAHLQGGGGGV